MIMVMKKWGAVVAVMGLVIMVGVGVMVWNRIKPGLPPQDESPKISDEKWERLVVPQRAAPGFKLSATTTSNYGVMPDETFVLESQTPITQEWVEEKLETSVPMKVERVESATYKLTPKKRLGAGEELKIKLAAVEREYAWAFMTLENLKVVGTLPTDKRTNVPVNTGIEFVFNRDDFEVDPAKVRISPETEFKVEKRGATLVVVPQKRLEYEQEYKVTLEGRSDVSFTTEQESIKVPMAEFASKWNDFDTTEKPQLAVFTTNWTNEKKVAVEVEKFRSGEEFIARGGNASRVMGVELAVLKTDQTEYIELPAALEAGWYRVKMRSNEGKKPDQAWVQVTDLAGYVSVGERQTVVWVNDLQSGGPVGGARVRLGQQSGEVYTAADGTVVFDTPQNTSGENRMAEISRAGQRVYLPLNYAKAGKKSADDYWSYVYHERSKYKPTDSLKVWGVMRERESGAVPQNLEAKIVSGYSNDQITIVSKKINVADSGEFLENLEFTDLPGGWYSATFGTGDVVINSLSFFVENYVKPELKIEIGGNKKAMFAGENVEYDIQTGFYDGTPAKSVDLTVTEGRTEKTKEVTTDKKGRAKYTYSSSYSGRDSDYPRYENIVAGVGRAEAATIEGYGSVYVFGSRLGMETKASQEAEKAKLDIEAWHVDVSKFETGGGSETRGKPATEREVAIKITKQWWERVEKGTYYDFVEKVTRVNYGYNQKSEAAGELKTKTDNAGRAQIEFNMEKERGYQVEATIVDDENRRVTSRQYYYFYEGAIRNRDNAPSAQLKADNKEGKYGMGEEIKLTIEQDQTDPGARYLWTGAVRGRQDYWLTDEPKLTIPFGEKFVPNVYLGVIIFDKRGYRPVFAGCEWNWNCYFDNNDNYLGGLLVRYRASDKEVTITTEFDQKQYAPGDKAEATVTVADKDGQAVVGADVNLVLVDEAMSAIGGVVKPNTLAEWYRSVGHGILRQDYSHGRFKNGGGAEKGGGGGETRELFKDTAVFVHSYTDQNGKARFEFELPDNITNWLVYAQTITADGLAGWSDTAIATSKPFFVTAQYPGQVLTRDKVVMVASSYGRDVNPGEGVAYTINKTAVAGVAGGQTYFDLPTQTAGKYAVEVTGKYKTLTDGVKLPITVMDSRLEFAFGQKQTLEKGESLGPVDWAGVKWEKGVEVTLTDRAQNEAWTSMRRYCWTPSNRAEKLVVSYRAGQVMKQVPGCGPSAETLTALQNPDGGVGAVRWGGSELETTMWAAIVEPRVWNKSAMLDYLEKRFVNSTNNLGKTYAAMGMGAVGRPVVARLNTLAQQAVSPDEKLMVAIGLAINGNKEKAREMYEELVADYGYFRRPYVRIQIKDAQGNYVTETAKMAWLGNLVGGEYGEAMHKYIRDYAKVEDLLIVDIAKIEYWKTILAKTPIEKTEVMVTSEGKTQRIYLSDSGGWWQKLSRAQVENLKVTAGSGRAEVRWDYHIGREGLTLSKPDPALGLSRSYKKIKDDGPIEPGDLVEIRLTYDFGSNAPPCGYEVTDSLPSGLVYVKNPGVYGLTSRGWARQTEGQTVKFGVCNSPWWLQYMGKSIVYYGRAVSPGDYLAEPAIMQYEDDPGVYTATKEERVIIAKEQ